MKIKKLKWITYSTNQPRGAGPTRIISIGPSPFAPQTTPHRHSDCLTIEQKIVKTSEMEATVWHASWDSVMYDTLEQAQLAGDQYHETALLTFFDI